MKNNLPTIRLKLIEEEDAEFVLSLRLDPKYNSFLSEVTADLAAQKEWIKTYKTQEKQKEQFYFIIERIDGTPCGTVRLYDFKGDSFCWGSWILNENKTPLAAVESALLVYEFGFEKLKFSKCHFDVMKGNQKVIKFHKKFGAVETGEDEENYYFEVLPEYIQKIKSKYKTSI